MISLTRPHARMARPKRFSAGFTLVEMLVSVALVLLMMSLFAQVFQIAAGTVSTQRGIMENDQRARSVQTVITKDLNNRTFRYVWPWAAGANSTPILNSEDGSLRDGYFYISENDPFDDTDDVLQFTGKITTTVNSLADTDSYTGSSERIGGSTNQPDFDDGEFGNLSSISSRAEIAFFMRKGTTGRPGALYRRIMLVRDVADPTLLQPDDGAATPNPLFTGTTAIPDRAFWKFFDFSVRPRTVAPFGVLFNSLEDLQNPSSRFGFQSPVLPNPGEPQEFLTDTAMNKAFIGRYTMEETSSTAFKYPMDPIQAMQHNTTNYTVNPLTNVVNQFAHSSANGSRRGEDLLLANVVSFDVKVWDDFANSGLGAFVDIGGPGSVLYSADPAVSGNTDRRLNANFGPGVTNDNNVFDTWGPEVRLNSVATDPAENPPFLPRRYIAGASASATELPRFTAGTSAGAVLPAELSGVSSIPGDPVFFVRSGASAGTSNAAGAALPLSLPIVYGTPIFDNAVPTPVEWTPVDNRRPLRLIQITVRFLDPTSQQLRTITMQSDLTP